MIIQDEILGDRINFLNLCKIHNVKYLYAFGSSTNDKFDKEKSDIDLLVEIDDPDPIERGDKLLSLWDTFETFFQRKVDLLHPESSLKNARKIVGFRNRIIHAYDAVDSSMIWAIIKRHLNPFYLILRTYIYT